MQSLRNLRSVLGILSIRVDEFRVSQWKWENPVGLFSNQYLVWRFGQNHFLDVLPHVIAQLLASSSLLPAESDLRFSVKSAN